MVARTAITDWGWEQTGPVWVARAYAPTRGQDHLGLGSVSSDRILPTFVAGHQRADHPSAGGRGMRRLAVCVARGQIDATPLPVSLPRATRLRRACA
jgi:hypothetical protein